MEYWAFFIAVWMNDVNVGVAAPTPGLFTTQAQCEAERARILSTYQFFSDHGASVQISGCYAAITLNVRIPQG